jgi:uncharacterized protein
MAHDAFISYASGDKAVADAVCAMLESNAVRCWIAPRDVLPGISYGEAIIDAIRGCRIMILVFSSRSNTSPHIPKEIERAVSAGVSVIPFRIEDVTPGKSLDYFIGSVHWLDALTPPLEQHLKRLVQNVQTLLSRDVPVIEEKAHTATLSPGSSATVASARSIVPKPGRSWWLYTALGVMAIVLIVCAALFFTRKPPTTADITPAPVNATVASASQPVIPAASQLSEVSTAAGKDEVGASKPAAATRPSARTETESGVHDNSRIAGQPETPASPVSPSTSAMEFFDQGLSAYKSGQFTQAADLYRKACDGGERKGCNSLGLMYRSGEGVTKDASRATDLFQRACDARGEAGCLNLGAMYMRGEGVSKGATGAADLFKRACDTGGAPGCTSLGRMYRNGEGVPKDLNRAADLFKRACDAGGHGGCVELGVMYYNGEGVPKDLNRAANLFKPACDAGDPAGCTDLGLMFRNGEVKAKDLNRAADLFKRGCDGGNSSGCNLLGMMYEHGRGMPKDLNRAADLFKRACDAHFNPGCKNLAQVKR